MAKSKRDQIRTELLALERRGIIKAEDVHAWAERNPKSAIYRSLEWDNEVAGFQYRLHQIRSLITLYIVDSAGEPEMVSLSIDRVKPGGGYRHLDDVKEAPDMRLVLLGDVLVDLERLASRYGDLEELVAVWRAVAEARAAFDRAMVRASRTRSGDATRPSV
jgi:hypothetical protein